MGAKTVRRAFAATERADFVPHTPLFPDRWTGVIQLDLRFSDQRPLVVGAGWFVLRGGELPVRDRERLNLGPKRRPTVQPPVRPPEVVAEIVRRQGLPVLPGSSLKGAVRQVYELLTPSCGLVRRQSCQVKAKEPVPHICPACSLFGAAGLGGRLAFGEAVPVSGRWAAAKAPLTVPLAWPPRQEVLGTVKVYDQEPATPREVRVPVRTGLTWAVWGDFRCRVRVVNAADEELGLLFASLGVGAASPMLRVGGKKYHGFGAADICLLSAVRSAPHRESLDAEALLARARELATTALMVPERRVAWEALHAALAARL